MKRRDEAPARYVLLVDHQSKRSFELRESVEREARRILERYPHLKVDIEDCELRGRRASRDGGR